MKRTQIAENKKTFSYPAKKIDFLHLSSRVNRFFSIFGRTSSDA